MTMLKFDASDLAGDARWLELSPAEARLLAQGTPFMDTGRWRGFAVVRGATLVARAVASVDPRQRSRAGTVGCLGFIWRAPESAAAPPPGGRAAPPSEDAVRRVLEAGIGWLQRHGAVTVRCPVQLSTWFGHRAMTGGFPDAGGPGHLPFEPPAHPGLPALLAGLDFLPAHRAVSCRVDSSVVVADTARAVARFAASGVRDRPIELPDLEGELRLLHRLAADAFGGSWGLSDCTFEEFASIYRPLAAGLDPGLVRLLHDRDDVPIGFALGIAVEPGAVEPGAAGPGDGDRSFVLKSLGLTTEARRRHPGLGAAFVGMAHRAALARGHRTGIHALMAEDSPAHRLTLRWGHPIREYATFERAAGR
jgi:hypothetical protein